MIKLGDTFGLQLDPHDYLRGWMEDYLPLRDRRLIAPSQAAVTQRGDNLLYFNYPESPEPAINQLVIPTGATRWAHMLMLVTESDQSAIYSEAGTGPLILQYRAERREDMAFVDSQGNPVPANHKTLKMTMWPLAAIPLTTKIVNSNQVAAGSLREGAYLIPLVDGRYWWQFRNVGAISEETFANCAAMLTYLTSRVDETVTIKNLHADYDKILPDVLENDQENLAVVLESVAGQLGLTVVPDMTVAGHASPTSGSKFALLDSAASAVIHAGHLAGLGSLDGAGGSEDISVPVPVTGDEFETDSSLQLPAKAEVRQDDDTTFLDVTAVTAGYARPTHAGSSVVLRYSWDDDVTAALTARIATDYYARYGQQHDISYIGVQQWQPTCFTDSVIHRQDVKRGQASALTRVRSIPFNLVPEEPSGGGGSGSGDGPEMGFVITDADCEAGTVSTVLESIDRYTGCGIPPGEDEYSSTYIIQDYLGLMANLTEDELVGAKAHAIYWNPYPGCTPLWDLRSVNWLGGC